MAAAEKAIRLSMNWSHDDEQELLRMTSLGVRLKSIASKLGRSPGSIRGKMQSLSRQGKLPERGKRLERCSRIIVHTPRSEIEDPPRSIPEPEGMTRQPWIDLRHDQCQWSLGGFFDPPSNTFQCCGLPVEKGERFCNHHMKYRKKGWHDEDG